MLTAVDPAAPPSSPSRPQPLLPIGQPSPAAQTALDPMSAAMAQFLAIPHDAARAIAEVHRVCVRPVMRHVTDRDTGVTSEIAIPCGSTREAVCPPCARKAQTLRRHQCAEGWHRTEEPITEPDSPGSDHDHVDRERDEQDHHDDGQEPLDDLDVGGVRRARSTRRRQDVPDLPRVPTEDRTIGVTFTAPNGNVYRPSMFLTLTLPSYGLVASTGAALSPHRYSYRRAALDALHFGKLVDRFWQNLRRCAGFNVQYFATVEPQRRLAPHLHAALRGAIPRATLKNVIEATYVQIWWPSFDRPVYTDRLPVWDGHDYYDPNTGELLPTWHEALDRLDPHGEPAHVVRFGSQHDMAGIVAPSEDADRAVKYLTKYLTKSIADAHVVDGESIHPGYLDHIDRLHDELRYLPCSERCANWLRYGIQPENAMPGLEPGFCDGAAHDRANLGYGGRRVLVSRQWSGKTLAQHRADRATVVRETLLTAGIVPPEVERMAASLTLPDGSPRFVWTDVKPDPGRYAEVILTAVAEKVTWRAQYENAKRANAAVDNPSSSTDPP